MWIEFSLKIHKGLKIKEKKKSVWHNVFLVKPNQKTFETVSDFCMTFSISNFWVINLPKR